MLLHLLLFLFHFRKLIHDTLFGLIKVIDCLLLSQFRFLFIFFFRQKLSLERFLDESGGLFMLRELVVSHFKLLSRDVQKGHDTIKCLLEGFFFIFHHLSYNICVFFFISTFESSSSIFNSFIMFRLYLCTG